MLSRVADSIYWMTRYIERAENIARFINVNLNLSLDMASDVSGAWQPLVMTTGDYDVFEKGYGANYSKENVIQFLALDHKYGNSIISCVAAARENARSVREIISSGMWEQINRSYLMLKDAAKNDLAIKAPHRFFKGITALSHMFTGLLHATMSQGEAFHFALLGQLLERADKTSRILDVKYFMLLPKPENVNSPYDVIQWGAVLKSTSGFETYRKQFHRIVPKQVCNFLIFDPNFPRSVRCCLISAQCALHKITGTQRGTVSNPAEKSIGRLCADLDYSDIDDVMSAGMHEYLDDLQTKINQVGIDIRETFFKIPDNQMEQTSVQVQ
ncbi:alpha-E domain-containing protein [Desulfobacter hydrogenophilus]|uniref:Alpha-E domain-containing protein n=1 Tax=Desulfobacter hydrogenophilus TaxID=2291 RepID=A0A328F8W5_9BACT|nr:alpha-E domain-containing protein [Desulfobacter hydrogenophilus]NDY72917.1 alpha-E domain-containing protein [Desulfobacter hydrogenophilus]QBH11831.1 alpha-E domain-containing protein [Desulfobacter hydrogenophilus]RAM01061.1 alpha-E domain-containing protein [Desulfobacter hydrogenophilus]